MAQARPTLDTKHQTIHQGCRCHQAHSSSALRVNAASRLDPSRTGAIRRAYMLAMKKRFDAIKKLIIQEIGKDDAFALEKEENPLRQNLRRKQFKFSTSKQKMEEFGDWIREQTDNKVLEVQYASEGRKIVGHSSWSNVYIDSAYKSGLRKTDQQLRRGKIRDKHGKKIPAPQRGIDSVFLAPIHADRVGLIYARQFSLLQGVTEDMDSKIGSVLAKGIADGQGPMAVAREMTRQVDISLARARMIARTETIWAHNEGILNMMEEAGVEGVAADVEWSTAGYNVCPDCEDLNGRVFTLEEARQVHPPLHPNCRCSFIPANIGEDESTRGEYRKSAIGSQYKDEEGKVELRGYFADKADFSKPKRNFRQNRLNRFYGLRFRNKGKLGLPLR